MTSSIEPTTAGADPVEPTNPEHTPAGPGGDQAAPSPSVSSSTSSTGDAATSSADAGGPGLVTCANCGEVLVEGGRFCEACGASTTGAEPVSEEVAEAAAVAGAMGVAPGDAGDAPAGTDGADTTLETPVPTTDVCDKCGGQVDADGYCTSCGHRAVEDVDVDDRGPVATATHRGRRHHRNEDAAALAATSEGWPVLVVSDGVSVSPNPHKASAAAVAAAAERLAGRPFGGDDDLVAAVAAAHEAASAVSGDDDPAWRPDGTHPACTIVVAVVTASDVHVANVGDARAHLLSPAGQGWSASQLTTDDSVAAQAVAQGMDLEVALNLPGGHGITAWLGADAPAVEPHVATRPAAPGELALVTSDGLWNYAATDESLGALATALLPPPGPDPWPPAQPAAQLVAWALEQGGADNITVALTALPSAFNGVDGAGAADGASTQLEENA